MANEAEKRLVVDVDGVIAHGNRPYAECRPYPDAKRYLALLRNRGYKLILCTARGMLTYDGDARMAEQMERPVLEAWLAEHSIEYDELHFGKPSGRLYVDNFAFRVASANGSADWNRLMAYLGEGDLNVMAPGDVVELKSGGPPMTVVALLEDGTAEVSYFDDDGELMETAFPVSALSVTERRRTGLDEEDVARAVSGEDDDDDGD